MRRLQDPAKCGRPVCESNDANEWQVNYRTSWAPKINSANRCCYWWRRPRIAAAANLLITQRVSSSCFIVRRAIAMVFVATVAQMAVSQFISRLRGKKWDSTITHLKDCLTAYEMFEQSEKLLQCLTDGGGENMLVEEENKLQNVLLRSSFLTETYSTLIRSQSCQHSHI